MSTLSERVTRAIKESGHSASSAARIIGCSPEAVIQWMNGPTKNLKGDFLFSLADLTGFEARWLATGKPPERSEGKDMRKEKLVGLYDKADQRGKDAILRVAELESSYGVKSDHPGEMAA
jgi:transcriptional regulator with XRE-family HTH domain